MRATSRTAYADSGRSKATFWSAKSIQALILSGQAENCLGDEPGLAELTEDCWKIASRMMRDAPVTELDALTATVDERNLETVAQRVREAIEKNRPEAALGRVHRRGVNPG